MVSEVHVLVVEVLLWRYAHVAEGQPPFAHMTATVQVQNILHMVRDMVWLKPVRLHHDMAINDGIIWVYGIPCRICNTQYMRECNMCFCRILQARSEPKI